LVLEIIMIKLCKLGDYLSFDQILQKLESLEKRLPSSALEEVPMAAGRLSEPGMDWQAESTPGLSPVESSEGIVKEDWERFLRFLGDRNRPMVNVLRDWPLLHTSGNLIEIGKGKSQFTSAYLDEPERFRKLTELCRDFFKRDVQIKITPQKDQEGAKVKPHKEEPTHPDISPPIQDVLDIFQGEVKGEIAVNPNQGENTGRD
jgi:DNA polymerase III subunit gamma/tau